MEYKNTPKNVKKIDNENPIPFLHVLLIGVHSDTKEELKTTGYRRRGSKNFVTERNGWGHNFTHYQEL